MRNTILIILCSLAIIGCYKDPNITGQYSDEYYVRHKGVDMPVWVRGKIDSEAFIIFIHGGPKLTGIREAVSNQFTRLEEKYAMVYYDQRSGGFTHGSRTENLSEEQLVEDLDVVIEFIKQEYPNAKSIFLMGHSWGGYLGTSYLTDPIRAAKINGWISLAGNHNLPFAWLAERDFIIKYANEQINADAADKDFWQEAIEKLTPLTEIKSFDDIIQLNFYAQAIDRTINKDAIIPYPNLVEIWSSPVGIDIEQRRIAVLDDLQVVGNKNPQMGAITLPVLLIYGRLDAIVPVAVGQNGYDFLGTPAADKKLVILEKSGHDIWRIEVDRFVQEITEFVEQYQ